ncbi:MAG: DUF3168 domain-containing protein [Tannerella sp.]|jgi:hypothetical protein|nr:DUF3168 domain-containing protein [Tannerella sp.]
MKVTETGTAIYQLLASDAQVSGMVGDRIFPLVAVQSTEFPFIAYRRSETSAGYTKDRLYQSVVTVDIVCVGTDYRQGVDMAGAVMDVLEGKRFAQYDIDSIRLDTAFEDYADDAFVQTLVFLITINK